MVKERRDFKSQNEKPNRPYLTVSLQHLCELILLRSLQQGHSPKFDRSKNVRYVGFWLWPIWPHQQYERNRSVANPNGYLLLSLASWSFSWRWVTVRCSLGCTWSCIKMWTKRSNWCFASPLNCRYNKIRSAFPDFDSRFGSIGSFFDDGPLSEGMFWKAHLMSTAPRYMRLIAARPMVYFADSWPRVGE